MKWGILIGAAVPAAIWAMPGSWIPIEGLTVLEHRMLVIFVMAALFWVFELIPIFATALLIVVAEILLISDQQILLLMSHAPGFGTPLDYRDILAAFGSPIIMLFLGGFFLALAASKYRLDVNLARILLKPFGQQPKYILLGLMVITAVFSMFMSNTATTAMMLAILMPVLNLFEADDPGRISFVIGIPFAANIGGIGTPIGTPPNAIAMKYLTGIHAVSFGQWMAFALPLVIVLLVFVWGLLCVLFPARVAQVDVRISGRFLVHIKAVIVYVTMGVTILLWLTDFWHGLNAYVVALIPVSVFAATAVVTAEDLKQIRWDVLWLVVGGIALGYGLEACGLARHVITQIPFDHLHPLFIIGLVTLFTIGLATLMSNTATANLVLPLVAALGGVVSGLASLGGIKMMVLAVTLSCSLAMALPVSTPPNAIAFASGLISTKQMARVGIVVGAMGLVLVYVLIFVLFRLGFF